MDCDQTNQIPTSPAQRLLQTLHNTLSLPTLGSSMRCSENMAASTEKLGIDVVNKLRTRQHFRRSRSTRSFSSRIFKCNRIRRLGAQYAALKFGENCKCFDEVTCNGATTLAQQINFQAQFKSECEKLPSDQFENVLKLMAANVKLMTSSMKKSLRRRRHSCGYAGDENTDGSSTADEDLPAKKRKKESSGLFGAVEPMQQSGSGIVQDLSNRFQELKMEGISESD